MIGEVGEVAHDTLVEIAELVIGKGVAVEPSWVRTPLQEGPNLMVLKTMIVVWIVKTAWVWRSNAGEVRKRISGRFVVGVICGGFSSWLSFSDR